MTSKSVPSSANPGSEKPPRKTRKGATETSRLFIDVDETASPEAGRLRMPCISFRRMTDAVATFFGDLQHSPVEIEVLTGATTSRVSELLSRLQQICLAMIARETEHPVQIGSTYPTGCDQRRLR